MLGKARIRLRHLSQLVAQVDEDICHVSHSALSVVKAHPQVVFEQLLKAGSVGLDAVGQRNECRLDVLRVATNIGDGARDGLKPLDARPSVVRDLVQLVDIACRLDKRRADGNAYCSRRLSDRGDALCGTRDVGVELLHSVLVNIEAKPY